MQEQNFRSGLVTIYYAIKLDVKYWKLKFRKNIEKKRTLKWKFKENSEYLAKKIGFIGSIGFFISVLYHVNVIATQKN